MSVIEIYETSCGYIGIMCQQHQPQKRPLPVVISSSVNVKPSLPACPQLEYSKAAEGRAGRQLPSSCSARHGHVRRELSLFIRIQAVKHPSSSCCVVISPERLQGFVRQWR